MNNNLTQSEVNYLKQDTESAHSTSVFIKDSEQHSVCMHPLRNTCNDWPLCYGCTLFKNPTQYDRIRAMSIEEMAHFIAEIVSENTEISSIKSDGEIGILQWLDSVVKG